MVNKNKPALIWKEKKEKRHSRSPIMKWNDRRLAASINYVEYTCQRYLVQRSPI
jgi:hypothetical protein